MTAQVAVLNTQGVALASDSTVTITGGATPRSYQSADKIFPIHGEPLAVLHSGTASFWGVPWQVLVEMWSQDRDPGPQPSMQGHAQQFVDWLATQSTVLTQEEQDQYFRWMVRDVLLSVRTVIHRRVTEIGVDPVPGYAQGPVAAIVDEVTEAFMTKLEAAETYEGLETFDGAALYRRLADPLTEVFEWVFDDTPRTTVLEGRLEFLGALLATKVEPFERDAVLAFVGYSAGDFFPSIYRMTVSGAIGDVVRVCGKSTSGVSTASKVLITPLGQTAAMDLFLRGVSPQYRAVAHDALDSFAASGSAEHDGDSGGDDELDIEAAHTALDEEFETLEWQSFLSPMLNVVETLPVVETLRLADALVGLASLRGLIHGESSVGGPVDLARITKQRGFEWVRSKNTQPPTLG